ncbi:MAG: hypothetical protein ACRD2N_01615 [Vicinamibacterales bacterium]
MTLSPTAPRRGRPPKFGRRAQLITLTLPEDVVQWLSSVDPDLGWAIVKLHERTVQGRRSKPIQVADLVQLPGQRALILVQPEPFRNLKGVSIIPLADGRGFLALESGRGVSDLELAVIDRLDSESLATDEREALGHLRMLLRQWRQDGVRFESRSIIVAHRRHAFGVPRPLSPLQARRRSSSDG